MFIKVERFWASSILFTNGWIFALPVTEIHLPVWFTPVQIFYGVFAYECLLLAYFAFFLIIHGVRFPRPTRRAVQIATLIAFLAALGLVSGIANVRPSHELIAAARYLLLAAYFLLAVYWGRRYGATFVLRSYLAGIAGAALVNLYYTFTVPNTSHLGGLPFLLGEQGPGGYLGMTVVLSSWLMLVRRTRGDVVIAVASCLIAIFAVTISFSKLAMLMAGAGIAAWILVLWRDFNRKRRRKWYATAFIVIAVILMARSDAVVAYIKGARTFFDYKFRYVDPGSVSSRSQYFLITAEILARHPMFGVGYGGFYDAALKTDAEKSPLAAPEDPEAGARGESNPHSSFLYYTMANGVAGLLTTLMIVLSVSRVLAGSVFRFGLAGKLLWGSLMFAYVVFGLTLPTLFNSSILYVPAAVSISLYAPLVYSPHRVSAEFAPAFV